jgi:hypothetical protein
MGIFTSSLWNGRTRPPYLRLAVAVVAAPVLLAATLTGIAFLVAGSTELTREETLAVTRNAAQVFFVVLPAFTLTAGLVGIALLWQLGCRASSAWAFAGSCAGMASVLLGVALGEEMVPMHVAVALVVGAAIFLLIRLFAGVRPS